VTALHKQLSKGGFGTAALFEKPAENPWVFVTGFSRNHPQMVSVDRVFTDYTYLNDSTEGAHFLGFCSFWGSWLWYTVLIQ